MDAQDLLLSWLTTSGGFKVTTNLRGATSADLFFRKLMFVI